MYKVTVIYGKLNSPDEFDYDYYVNKHIPMAVQKLGARRAEVDRFTSNPQGGEQPFHVLAHLYFDSQDALTRGLAAPDIPQVLADIPNYYRGKDMQIVISESQEYAP